MLIIEWVVFRNRLNSKTMAIIIRIGFIRFCQLCASTVLTTFWHCLSTSHHLARWASVPPLCNAICSRVHGPRACHPTWSKPDKDRYPRTIGSLKNDTNELISKQKQTHSHRKQTYGYQREKEGRWKLGV